LCVASHRRLPADLRVHRHRHRWARVAGGCRNRIRRGGRAAAARELLPGRYRRPGRRVVAGRGAADQTVRTIGEESMKSLGSLTSSRWTPWVVGGALVALFAVIPFLNIEIPGVLPGPTYLPGTLQLLALSLLFASLALSYHLLFGTAGMLSFGHALYFAAGAYGLGILLKNTDLGLVPAMGITLAGAVIVAYLLGAVSLRVTGIS